MNILARKGVSGFDSRIASEANTPALLDSV